MAGRDVRAEILATAREVLNDQGAGALSMRDVARRAGVTHQAPYHYFANREAILAEVITGGFEDLAAALREANDLLPGQGARAALVASGEAYVRFALTHPGVFRAMFRGDVDPAEFKNVRDAGAAAFTPLAELVAMVHGPNADPVLTAIYWAHVHGLASLAIDGPLVVELASAPQRDAMLRETTERFADLMLASIDR